MRVRSTIVAAGIAALMAAAPSAQVNPNRSGPPPPPLPATFWTSETPIRVVPVASGLSHPWGFVFLPDGDILITERPGRLRIVRKGVLDPQPIGGVPAVRAAVLGGLLDVALHPKFAENKVIYLSYSKANAQNLMTTALARATFTGTALSDVTDIFIADNTWSKSVTNFGGRIAFDKDGFLFMTVGERQEQNRAQDGNDHGGKVIRLHDDGRVPADNPFVGKAGFKPEIYSWGHRSPQGLAFHPETGALWENEHGPLGGD
jgi:glucose/arabinose dehydrogenase